MGGGGGAGSHDQMVGNLGCGLTRTPGCVDYALTVPYHGEGRHAGASHEVQARIGRQLAGRTGGNQLRGRGAWRGSQTEHPREAMVGQARGRLPDTGARSSSTAKFRR